MPKNIEQYYQEIGRAGRDGLPADCLMLYSAQDLVLCKHFAESEKDPLVRANVEKKAEALYYLCRNTRCRRIGLLKYFGEIYHASKCVGCDNCMGTEEVIDGTVIAQKILSCVYRLKFEYGIKHVIDVLRGSTNSIISAKGHDKLSTYNLMPECSVEELRYYIDSLLILGFLKSSSGSYPVLRWTERSAQAIKGEEKIMFRKVAYKENSVNKNIALSYNNELFENLKKLRLKIAREEELPPFSIFNDQALLEMATFYPFTEKDILTINGVGRFKYNQYGERFLTAIKDFCAQHQIQSTYKPLPPARPVPPAKQINESAETTWKLFLQKKSIDEVAKIRGLTRGTIIVHICQQIELCPGADVSAIAELVPRERQQMINAVIDHIGFGTLSPIKAALPDDFTFDEIRLTVALRKSNCPSPVVS